MTSARRSQSQTITIEIGESTQQHRLPKKDAEMRTVILGEGEWVDAITGCYKLPWQTLCP
jgi:hypothetical protein